MSEKLKEIIERAQSWPEAEQAELAEYAQEIESRHSGEYVVTEEELATLDAAAQGKVATKEQVAAAFRAFRRA